MVSAPPLVTNIAFILATLIGLIIIVMTLIRPPKPDDSTANVGWGKRLSISLKGRGVIQLLVGAVLLVFPALVSSTMKPAVAPETKAKTVPHISDPRYDSFVFIRDFSILDLRNAQSQPLLSDLPLIGKKSNPVTLLNEMSIRKIAPSDVIAFTYSTTGTLDVRCLTQTCTVERADEPDQHGMGVMNETYELDADVRNISVGQEFTMLVEVTYWNAFNTPEKQWYATYGNAQSEPETAAMVLLFPDQRPFSEYQLLSYAHGGTAEPFNGTSTIIPGSGNRSLFWSIADAQGDRTFEVHWKW